MIELTKFLSQIESISQRFFPSCSIESEIIRSSRLNVRIFLRGIDLFLDIFYSVDTGRKDFALIWKKKRIFGFDNLQGWHYHPYEAPEQHISCPEPSLENLFEQVKGVAERLEKD